MAAICNYFNIKGICSFRIRKKMYWNCFFIFILNFVLLLLTKKCNLLQLEIIKNVQRVQYLLRVKFG